MKKAYTIIELLVAMTIIVILLAGSGYVFHTAVQAEKSARATAEIARKLRGITDQLNADFKGIKYEGEMFFAWEPSEVYDYTDPLNPIFERYERFDQMMFFTDGNFNSYRDNPLVEGNIARVQYTLAVNSAGDPLSWQEPSKRVLARVQHIYTPIQYAAPDIFPELDPAVFDDEVFRDYEAILEFDNTTMDEWKNMDDSVREDVYTVISNLRVNNSAATLTGVIADTSESGTIHKVLCEGVGEFIIQDSYWDPYYLDPVTGELGKWRWYPENDPTFDGDYSDTDFYLNGAVIDTTEILGWIHPGDDTFFNTFGRAFKFTFTLYDSYGVFPEGKTFSHIIYLRQD